MRPWVLRLTVVFFLLGIFQAPVSVQAAKGTPQTADFGFGARVDLSGELVPEALQAASRIRLDWIAIDFDWAAAWPNPAAQPNLFALDTALQAAQATGQAVMISITDAPAWALTELGPDPVMTARLMVTLAQRYPETIQAFEPFPGANTRRGWGRRPDPTAYANLICLARQGLAEAKLPALIAAGGLQLLGENADGEDVDDLRFLTSLYQVGAAGCMPVVSLRLPDVTGDPLQPASRQEHHLRHYEEVRQVMLANNNSSGVLWITELAFPSGRIPSSDVSYKQPGEQAAWLSQAYRQLRAQLYIGVVFYQRLNPAAQPVDATGSLINRDRSTHPFFELLGRMIAQNNQKPEQANPFDGPQNKHITKVRT